MRLNSIVSVLQEAEYAIYQTPDGRLEVQLIAVPRPANYRPDLRLHRIGISEVPLRVEASHSQYQIPFAVQREVMKCLVAELDAPDPHVCGSNSPLAVRPPYRGSDLDLVCFVPVRDIAERPVYWTDWLRKAKDDVAPSLTKKFDVEVSIGLLATEQRCLPGMADVVSAEELDSAQDFKEKRDLVERRIVDFIECVPKVERDLLEFLDCIYGDTTLSNGPVLYAGPRWFDITEFFFNPSRRRDLR